MKKEDLLTGEIIGLYAKIGESTNRDSEGISGKVVDETKETIELETKDGLLKRFIKQNQVFIFTIDGQNVRVEGKNLAGRPEERIKKWLRRKR